jgi:trehalose/maltose transport system permease protein
MRDQRLGITATATAAPVGRLRETAPTSKWAKNRERMAWAFVAPAILVVAVVALYPLARTFQLSFTNARMGLGRKTVGVGLDNYRYIFHDDVWWTALKHTLIFTVASVGLETLFGIIIALTIHSNFKGRGIVRTSMLVPWAIPTVVSAQMWKFMYIDVYGIVPDFFGKKLGIMDPHTALLAKSSTALPAVIAVDVWKTTPFMALLVLAGLQIIPGDIYESSNIDGASKVRQFFDLTLPLLKPSLLVALVFRTMDAFRVYDLVAVMKGAAPDTMTVAVYAQNMLVGSQRLGRGSAAAVLIFVIIAVFAFIYTRMLDLEEMG